MKKLFGIIILFLFLGFNIYGATYYLGDTIRGIEEDAPLDIVSIFERLEEFKVDIYNNGNYIKTERTNRDTIRFDVILDSKFINSGGETKLDLKKTAKYRVLGILTGNSDYSFTLGNKGFDASITTPDEDVYKIGDTIKLEGTAKDKDKLNNNDNENIRLVIENEIGTVTYFTNDYVLSTGNGYSPGNGKFSIDDFFTIPADMPFGRYKITMYVVDRPISGWTKKVETYFIVQDSLPYGKIENPLNNENIRRGQNFTISGTANDPDKPKNRKNGIVINIPTITFYSGNINDDTFSIDVTMPNDYPPGTHTMQLLIYDYDKDEYILADEINISVENILPTGRIITPSDNLILYGGDVLNFQIEANDPDKTMSNNRIKFFVSGIEAYTYEINSTYYEWSYEIPHTLSNGSQYISLEVYDYATDTYIEVDRINYKKADPLLLSNVYDNVNVNYKDVDSNVTFDKTKLYFRIKMIGELLGNDALSYGISESPANPIYTNRIENIDRLVYDVSINHNLIEEIKYYVHIKLETNGKVYTMNSNGISLAKMTAPDIIVKKYKDDSNLINDSIWTNTGDIEKGRIYFKWDTYTAIDNENIQYEYKLNGDLTYLSTNNNEIYRNVIEGKDIFRLRIKYSFDGITYYSEEREFNLWVDDTPPNITKYIIDDRSSNPTVERNVIENGQNVYFTNATETYMLLELVENLSGIKNAYYNYNFNLEMRAGPYENMNINSLSINIGNPISIEEDISDFLNFKSENENLIIPLYFEDEAGNKTVVDNNLNNIFVLDKTAPQIDLNNLYVKDNDDVYRASEPNTYYFNSYNSFLNITATDNIAGIKELNYDSSLSYRDYRNKIFFNGEKTPPIIEAESSTLYYAGDGEKNVYVKVWDRAGNIANYQNNNILYYDVTKPNYRYLLNEIGQEYKNENDESFYIGYVIADKEGNLGELKSVKSGVSEDEPFIIQVPTGSSIKLVFRGADNESGLYKFNGKDTSLNGIYTTNNSILDWDNYEENKVNDLSFILKDKAGNEEILLYNNVKVSNTSFYEIETFIDNYNKKSRFKYIERQGEKGKFDKYDFGEY